MGTITMEDAVLEKVEIERQVKNSGGISSEDLEKYCFICQILGTAMAPFLLEIISQN